MNKVCLKGGLRTPVGGGVSSLNVSLRKELDLYALIRENTEGDYSGLEHEVVPGVVKSLNIQMCLTGHKYRESVLRQVITKVLFDRIANSTFIDPLMDFSNVLTLALGDSDQNFSVTCSLSREQAEKPLVIDMTASVETFEKSIKGSIKHDSIQNSELAPCTLHLSIRILLHRR
ncbi:unnamed protein product [Musa acuminata subsp. burmannicoides]